ncbi:MAG: hypothetical protein Kow0092_05090 [Deferrisomatales bacterium]
MGLSEFNVHNVLRTYSRQERLARVQRTRPKAAGPTATADRVSLSPAGRKVQWLGQFAGELVDREHPELAPEERATAVRRTQDDLLHRHREELASDSISPEGFEARLRHRYLG